MPTMPLLRSFQSRLLFFFVGLYILAQVLAFLAVDSASTQTARVHINDELTLGGKVFDQVIQSRSEQLLLASEALTGDLGFKSAFGSRDTMSSAHMQYVPRRPSLFRLPPEKLATNSSGWAERNVFMTRRANVSWFGSRGSSLSRSPMPQLRTKIVVTFRIRSLEKGGNQAGGDSAFGNLSAARRRFSMLIRRVASGSFLQVGGNSAM